MIELLQWVHDTPEVVIPLVIGTAWAFLFLANKVDARLDYD
jgi:hypothetical protein